MDPFNACNRDTKTGLDMRSSLSQSQDGGKQQVAQQGKHKFSDSKHGCTHWDMWEATTHNKERMNSFWLEMLVPRKQANRI